MKSIICGVAWISILELHSHAETKRKNFWFLLDRKHPVFSKKKRFFSLDFYDFSHSFFSCSDRLFIEATINRMSKYQSALNSHWTRIFDVKTKDLIYRKIWKFHLLNLTLSKFHFELKSHLKWHRMQCSKQCNFIAHANSMAHFDISP